MQGRETALGQRNDALQALLDEPIDWRYKGFPPSDGVTIGTVGQTGWNLLDGSLPLPALVLKDSALAHNIALMARWCEERRILHAPHGKTTMAPQLFSRQLDAGAWGITAATANQARMYRASRRALPLSGRPHVGRMAPVEGGGQSGMGGRPEGLELGEAAVWTFAS